MSKAYWAGGGPRPTTAAFAVISTGTAIKTLIQLASPSTEDIKIIEWGISFDGSTAATPIKCELIETDVAATVTAFAAADLIRWNQPNDPASLLTVGTSASGYAGSAEGSITATRPLDTQLIAPTNQYFKQFPLGREPVVGASKFLRIRVTAGASVNAYPYIIWEE
jgi:hypothetical protein